MHIKPKKRLGQNFLIDKNIQKKILSACAFSASDTVLEIGAGTGIMTRLLACQVKKVYAVEIDRFLYAQLEAIFKGNPAVELICADILACHIDSLVSGSRHKIKVFGNIPYYITSPIIAHLFSYKGWIDTIFLTVQKEFAQRIVAKPGSKEYGSFSCFVQYHAQAGSLFSIPKGCFHPQPKVDSALIELRLRKPAAHEKVNEEALFKIIRAAFNQRRKTLRNSLADVIAPSQLEAFFRQYAVDPRIRPEDLSLQDFIHLAGA